MATNFILETDAEITAYFNEWLEEINSQIREKQPKKSIDNFPEIQDAFTAMQKAWVASFTNPEIVDRMHARDAAIQMLGIIIQRNLLR
jgi:hypothetical protein